jgi:Domain of unknown function (DUF5664)
LNRCAHCFAFFGGPHAIGCPNGPGAHERTPDPTNPKDMIGATKLPLGLVPDTIDVYAAMAFAEGASKYGAFNWRAAGVRFSIYLEALRRHTIKLSNGEWADPRTNVPHLASIIACAGIIADAKLCGKLVDDRPPVADMGSLIEGCEEVAKHVAALNADKTPHHWTIEDKV